MSRVRDEKGHFIKGKWKGGPGRPPKAREEKYRYIFTDTIPPEKFRASCYQIWLDSVGKKLNKDGKLVTDAKSTPHSRTTAFVRIAEYALGKPVQPLLFDHAEGELLDVFRQMSDEHLDQVIAEARRIAGKTERTDDA